MLRPKIEFLANARPFLKAGVAQLVAQFVDDLAAVLAGVGRQHGQIPVFCSDNYIFLDLGPSPSFHLQIFAQPPPDVPDLRPLEQILFAAQSSKGLGWILALHGGLNGRIIPPQKGIGLLFYAKF